MGGRASATANTQSAAFSPFSVPTYVLGLLGARWPRWRPEGASSPPWARSFFARLLGMRSAAACSRGSSSASACGASAWVSWTTMSVWACLPLVLAYSGEVLLRRPGPLPFAGLAVLIGLQWFGGHPATNFQVLVPVVAVLGRAAAPRARGALAARAAARGVARRRPGRGHRAGGGAAHPLPRAARASPSTSRSAPPTRTHQLTHYLLGVFLPDYWGRSTRGPSSSSRPPWRSAPTTSAALPLMLAVVALLRPTRGRVTAAAGALVALAAATGIPPIFSSSRTRPGSPARTRGGWRSCTVLAAPSWPPGASTT